jgi:hypothetical protein
MIEFVIQKMQFQDPRSRNSINSIIHIMNQTGWHPLGVPNCCLPMETTYC